MKLIIGDIHLKKMTINVVSEVLEKCRKLATKCKVTVFLGDVNDTKANIRSEALTLLLNTLQDWPTPVIMMIGNHDLHNSLHPEDGHSLEALKLLDNVTIVDEPMLIDDSFYVPYYPEEQFQQIKLLDADYLFLHQDMDKASYSNQSPVKSQLNAQQFAKYKRVFVGHIHLPQEFDNVIYVGTPYTESYKEANEEKRVVVFNPEKDKVMSVPMNIRRHLSFEYTLNTMDDIKAIKADLKPKVNNTDHVRIVINCPAELEHKIKKSLFADCNVDKLKTLPRNAINKDVRIHENMTNVEIMERYLKTLQGFDAIMDKLIAKNKEILSRLQ